MVAKSASSTASTAARSARSAPKNVTKDATKRGPAASVGTDETMPDFSDTPVAATPAKTKPKSKAAAKAPAKPDSVTVSFTRVKETSGTFQFREVDAAGNVLEMKDAVVGSLYIRKDKVSGEIPASVSIVVNF